MIHNIVVKGGKTVRLPTAGKYCDRDILVTAEGGGIALDVIAASSLPDTVVDGQIVIITDTTPGKIYIDTDEQANPETGDVWVKLDSGAEVSLVLSEDTPHVQGGLAVAMQRDETAWLTLEGHMGVAGTWEKFSSALPPVGTSLNDMTWEQISMISSSGKADEYFSVGDAKEITINGTVGNTTFSDMTIYAFIIGIYHNPEYEGGKFIHFQIGKSDQTNGKNLCLIDAKYGQTISTAGYFAMNYANTNGGGWKDSKMRTVLIGGGNSPKSPLAGSLMAALPQDLRDVLRGVTKYTDNKGASSNKAADVTETLDYLWLPSEYEVFGVKKNANAAEQTWQKQYAYYASGNAKVYYRHNNESSAAIWWTRSPCGAYSSTFCVVSTSGSASDNGGGQSNGIAPCFCV